MKAGLYADRLSVNIEIPTISNDDNPNLDLDFDPKVSWALAKETYFL